MASGYTDDLLADLRQRRDDEAREKLLLDKLTTECMDFEDRVTTHPIQDEQMVWNEVFQASLPVKPKERQHALDGDIRPLEECRRHCIKEAAQTEHRLRKLLTQGSGFNFSSENGDATMVGDDDLDEDMGEVDRVRAEHDLNDDRITRMQVAMRSRQAAEGTKDNLMRKLYAHGVSRIKKLNINVAGWAKDISPILTHGVGGLLAAHWDDLAGFDQSGEEGLIDTYDLGLTSIDPKTAENKISQIRGFTLYLDALSKSPPFRVEDVFSYCMRCLEAGKIVKETVFNSIISTLAPLQLLVGDFFTERVCKTFVIKLRDALKRDAIEKCEPWSGDVSSFKSGSIDRYMAILWTLSGTRFSTISALRLDHVMLGSVDGVTCRVLTFWSDKVVERQGRQVCLSCNCADGQNPKLSWCAVHADVDVEGLRQAMTVFGWERLRAKMGVKMHSMRRRVALEIERLLRSPLCVGSLALKRWEINCFLGWALSSAMFEGYTFDHASQLLVEFPLATRYLLESISLTVSLETRGGGRSVGGVPLRQQIMMERHAMIRTIASNQEAFAFEDIDDI